MLGLNLVKKAFEALASEVHAWAQDVARTRQRWREQFGIDRPDESKALPENGRRPVRAK